MSSGKTHTVIGVGTSIALVSAYTYTARGSIDLTLSASVIAGAVFGSLIVDIDTKKSKAAQAFAKVITTLVWVYLIGTVAVKYMPSLSESLKVGSSIVETSRGYLSSVCSNILSRFLSFTTSSTGMFFMCVLITLGKLSPHRQFTHKLVGTSLFLLVGFLTFSYSFFIGYAIGYVMHLVADSRTPAGLDFFDIKLPMQNSKGKFKMVV